MLVPNRIEVSIVIVNFRTPTMVNDCLSTLLPELAGLDVRVVIVDNHSEDSSPTIIRAWLAEHDVDGKVLLVQSDKNLGFAGGNNVGIRALKAKKYLLLNSDTLIRSGAIRIILDTADRFPTAGLVSPRLEWPDGTGQQSCFQFHTPLSEFIASAQTGLITQLLKRYIVALPVQSQIAKPEWTSFACVLIRGEVFDQIGLLDEGYFMYFEDVEFCYRARRHGWGITHNPHACVVHLRGGSSPVKERTRQGRRLPKYFYESRTRLFFQLYGWSGLTITNLLWWLGRMISKTRQMLGRSDKSAIEGQWQDIWTNWLNPLSHYTHPKP